MATHIFQLFAPYNRKAWLSGSFTDWKEIELNKDGDGYFTIEQELGEGRHEYLFHVESKSWFYEENQKVPVTDPYASEVVDDEDQHAVIHVIDGEVKLSDYRWKNDQKPLPQNNELIIYELLVHDFTQNSKEAGNFESLKTKLDYLTDLGVTAVELLPIEEYPGQRGWGYNPRHFFAVESSYGTPGDLMSLVDECHGKGLRVFKDGVYNHAETSCPLAQIDHDYWFHHEAQDAEQNWGPEFNYVKYDEHYEVRPACQFVGDVVGHWAHNYKLDGIRFDAVAQMNNYEVLTWLDSKGYEISGKRPFVTIAESMPPSPDVVKPNGPVDSCWNVNFHYTMKEMLCGENVSIERIQDCVDPRRKGFTDQLQIVNYLTSHDHNHTMADLGKAGILEDEAFKRARLGAIVLMTAIGVPMIWQGQEFGNYTECKQEPQPVDWSLLENENGAGLHQLYKSLIRLRRSNTALQGSDLDFFHVHPELPILAYVRWNGEGSRVVTVVNFSDSFIEGYALTGLPADGEWHDWVKDFKVSSTNRILTIDLADWEARVFVL